MPAVGLPLDVYVELRGVAPAYEYTHRESGEVRHAAATAKFEYELPNGDVGVLEVRGTAFEKSVGSFDFNGAQRGDHVHLVGEIRNGERGAYPVVMGADLVERQEA